MKWMLNQIRQEPVLFQGLVQAAIALGVAFGWQLDGTKVGAITAFSAAILSFLTRQAVTPLTNPKDSAGNALVPAGPAAPGPAIPAAQKP